MIDILEYWKKLRLIAIIQATFETASAYVSAQYGGFEIEYDEKTQNWVGTPYYYDESYLWRKG